MPRLLNSESDKIRRELALFGVLRGSIPLIAWIVLGLYIVSTFTIWNISNTNLHQREKQRFERQTELLDAALRARLDLHETALRGARSLFDASLSVERDEWRRYVAGLDIAHRLADLRGVGFIEYVPRTNLAAFLALTRKDESPDFKYWPEGDRDDYHIVKFLEPKVTNAPPYCSCQR